MKLLEPVSTGKTTFKNRIMFPPVATGYEGRCGSIGEQSFHFYKRLAEGGAGYIVIGDVAPVATFSQTPKLFREDQIPSFKRLADACHVHDCRLGIQLFYPEYNADALNALFAQGKMDEARAKLNHDLQFFADEITEEHMEQILGYMENCARLAFLAGVDCIGIHGGRLVGALCSGISNHRTDSYGGSFPNRVRFALNLVRRLREAVPDMTLDYKLPIITDLPDGTFREKNGLELREATEFAALLEEAGADMLHIAQADPADGVTGADLPAGAPPCGPAISYAKSVRKNVSIPVSCAGRIITPEAAEAIVASGKADIVGLGRSLLADPDFARKCVEGRSRCVRTCIMCSGGCTCSENTVGNESSIHGSDHPCREDSAPGKSCTDHSRGRAFLSCVLNAENGYENSEYIFLSHGERVTARLLNTILRRCCRNAGISEKGMHKIRKTYISTLIDSEDININFIREQVGHTDERTTYGNYCFNRKSAVQTAQAMEKALAHTVSKFVLNCSQKTGQIPDNKKTWETL